MQSISPDYKARKQGQPTMPLKERLYSKIKVNEYTIGMYVGFGTSSDNTYLCEYETTQSTKSMCIGLANELKARLKAEWKSSVKLGYQAYGDRL